VLEVDIVDVGKALVYIKVFDMFLSFFHFVLGKPHYKGPLASHFNLSKTSSVTIIVYYLSYQSNLNL